MCGIVGYIGEQAARDIVFEGLKRLEYRGYDSSGVAVSDEAGLHIQKAASKLVNLEPLLSELPQTAQMAIAHTRWATHGAPTVANAHPHRVGDVVLVHNGIIENYRELKASLPEGVVLKSETDSEVVAALISAAYEAGAGPREAFLAVLGRLRGNFALGVMFAGHLDKIYLAKHGSPLAVGLGQDEYYFGSDATAFLGKARQAVYLQDGDVAEISREGVAYFDFAGKTQRRQPVMIEGSVQQIDKMGYKHFMLKEIHEQPSVMAATLDRFIDFETNSFRAERLGGIQMDAVTNIHIVACGSAYLSGAVARYFLEPLLQLPVNVELASEFRYREPALDERSLVISISQSGETADTLACVQYAKTLGAPCLSFCNTDHSAIVRASDGLVAMKAGQEIGVASTKAFTSQILCMYLWGLYQAQAAGRLHADELEGLFAELRRLPLHLDAVIGQKPEIEATARRYYESRNFIYLGRGLSYPIALEGALKLKEISYIHAEGYGAGELKHGPIALIDSHMPILAVVPDDRYFDKSVANIEEVICREGRVIGIGPADKEHLREICADYIAVPQSKNDVVQALINAVPLQLFAYYVACHCGTDVDQPRNLAKSVTVE